MDLDTITTSPGAYTRLSWFFIVCSVAGDDFNSVIVCASTFLRHQLWEMLNFLVFLDG